MTSPTFALAPQYDARSVEPRLYKAWLDRGLFTAHADSPREPYVIVIPPPNVTASLHMGHGLDEVVQDTLIRFERMRGREALWLPGTDHAGIATQNVVERLLAKEGKTRFDLGRERFVERVWEHVKATGHTILEQLKVIGSSCDWSRTRFTLDPAYSRAVREVFVRLWEQDLVYRGHRVIHWCPRCLTALSDEEAEFHETTGTLYHFRYPLASGSGAVTVATTRPETMLGDTAVAVHPEDDRYRGIVGQRVRLPIANVDIPIVADTSVDPAFGTGAVKVTPAHDASDFEIGLRHGLEMPLVMAEDGRMQDAGGRVPKEIEGLDRFDARKRIVAMLDAAGVLVKQEPHQHALRRCYRCDSIVEPRLSDQWFVRMQPLADPVLRGFERGEFRIVPDRWVATFDQWMTNIRDWNISRQLWWGHRIPVFTCTSCRHVWADREDPERCPKCGGSVQQDPDVLDTWFSSWLWPFATLGWPQKTADLARFYPGHTLVTGPDILFFWVARMLMSGYHFMGETPFRTVFLHGIVRDAQHRKMSKSLGNGIDPLDVVQLFGADALRWTVVAGMALGQDLILDPDDLETTFAPGRNFANKLWNIGRFVLAQLPEHGTGPSPSQAIDELDPATLTLADRWILTRASETVQTVTTAFNQFRLDEAAKRCYEFAWKELADWYVEAVKPRLGGEGGGGGSDSAAAQVILLYCFDTVLRLLHPVVPFITEELWQKLPGRRPDELLAGAAWPEPKPALESADAALQFERVKQAIERIRSIRAEYRIAPKERIRATIVARGTDRRETFEGERETITRLAQLSELSFNGDRVAKPGAHAVFGDGSEILVPLEGALIEKECRRLSEELARIDRQIQAQAAKLGNESFLSRAPADVVQREREKEREWHQQRSTLVTKLESLGCS
jgi:valyl-tRNA synthetase